MINIQFVSFKCSNYQDELVVKENQVVVGPNRIIEVIKESGDKEYIIRSGCSAYYSCVFPKCRYSRASKDSYKKEDL